MESPLYRVMFEWEILLIGFIVTAKFPKRSHFWLRVAAAVGLCSAFGYAWSMLFFTRFEPLAVDLIVSLVNYLCAFAVAVCGICACVQLQGWASLYVSTAFWFTQQASNMINQTIGELLPGGSWVRHMLCTVITALVVYALFMRKVNLEVLARIRLQNAVPVWLLMCLACVMLNSYASYTLQDTTAYSYAVLLIDLLGLLYQNSVYRMAGLERENEATRLLLAQSRKQYQISKENMEQVNIKCHDLRHQIRRFRGEGRIDESVLQDMEQAVDAYDTTVKTGNSALDVLLTEKSLMCRSKKIGFTCMADGRDLIYMEPADLYALFGNALDNAIEATEQLANPEQKQIVLTIHRVGEYCSVHLQNYTAETLQLQNGLPVTHKPDTQNHGFGARSMQLLVEKYNGELSFEQKNDVVNLYMLLPAHAAE
jgi:hypothetical protein